MRFLLLFLLLAAFGLSVKGQQNLVPNPSFEDTVYCPFYTNQIDACQQWMNFGNSPDYFNACNSTGLNVPNCSFGFQYAHSGNAMAGVCTYLPPSAPSAPNYREFIGVSLLQPLQIGTKYYFSFYCNFSYVFGIATNKLGLRFSPLAFDSCCQPPINNFAHLFADSVLTDTVAWVRLSGSFIADSAYQYLVIGNFHNDANTDTLMFDQDNAAYYFIDDVCVSTDSLFNEVWTGIKSIVNQSSEVSIYPNPFHSVINIKTKEVSLSQIKMYSISGQLLYHNEFNDVKETTLDLSSQLKLNEGLYIVELTFSSGIRSYCKIIYKSTKP
ncbi:MAG: T9SS type A sorting domain-containing protein [Bacteroidetes bacterium]|nr:T9SS type A sorting domain-containing protein [Bacteroidota bacterium]